MGVPGLWKILQPAAQKCSLTEVATVKGHVQDHHGSQTMVIGIDASIWMKRSLAQFHHSQHVQARENPELCALFYRLCHLLHRPITVVFVFDGSQWAMYKHNRLVVTQPIWITQLFQAFIATFGFHLYMVFDIKKDGDTVTFFTETAIWTKQEVQLMQGGMLLMVLLAGGDYNTAGLPGCGATTAFKLSHTGLGDSLLHAAQQLPAPELVVFLISWQNELQKELSTDESEFLGWHFPSLADSVHNNFPALHVIYQYVKPVTSWSNGTDGLDTSSWLPLQPCLSELVLCWLGSA